MNVIVFHIFILYPDTFLCFFTSFWGGANFPNNGLALRWRIQATVLVLGRISDEREDKQAPRYLRHTQGLPGINGKPRWIDAVAVIVRCSAQLCSFWQPGGDLTV